MVALNIGTILAELQEQGDIPDLELGARASACRRPPPRAGSSGCGRARSRAFAPVVSAPSQVGVRDHAQDFILVSLAEHSAGTDARFVREVAAILCARPARRQRGSDDALVHVTILDPAELQRSLLALKRAACGGRPRCSRLQAIEPPAPVPVRPGLGDHRRRADASGGPGQGGRRAVDRVAVEEALGQPGRGGGPG